MEFKIKRDPFLKSISRAYSVTEKGSNMPILSTALISSEEDHIKIFATDLEISFQETLPAEVFSEGSAAIPAKKLLEILRKSKGDIFHVKKEENQRVFISDGNTEFKLAFLPPEEFILTAEPEQLEYTEIEASDLREMIKKTIYNVSSVEEMGYKFSGIFVEKKEKDNDIFLRFVATDGSRLSLIDKKIPGIEAIDLKEGIFVPKKGMVEINKMAQEGGSASIALKDRDLIVKKDNRVLIIRLLDIKFPQYENALPKESKFLIKIERNKFIDALGRMLIFTTDAYRAVIFIINKEKIELISTNPELGEAHEKIDVESEGEEIEEMKIAFNPKFFLDAIQPMESKFVNLGFIDKERPCIITGDEDPYYISLIMPMRI